MSVVCLCVSPILIVGSALEQDQAKGLTESSGEELKEANLLCGDAIINYKTIQSFGFEDFVVE